ncbi:MAG: universal stress protein [Deltaproteobacteria bacterium]|nr:universal stress protein [Deltaproteobacteria bacterium]
MNSEKAITCPGRWESLLVCTDGSDEGGNAVTQALALGQACGSKVYALQLVEIVPEFEAVAPDLRVCLEEEIHRQKVVAASEAALRGVQLEYRVVHSVSPFAAIVAEADQIQPGLILMGRYGRTALLHLAMGSVTARVIGLSSVNVLVVPQGAALSFKRLLIASDGSPYSDAALTEAIAMASRASSELLGVVVAREEGEIPEAQEIVHRMLTAANREGVSFQGFSPQGLAADDGVIQVALENHVDLIIMGSHGRTGFKKLLMGSVTERVIGQTPCPVLVVKKK